MWWIKTDSSGEDQNGFQNRDFGKRSHDLDFGPDFGVDYARYCDPPDIVQDSLLRDQLDNKLAQVFADNKHLDIKVRNGFVIVKADLLSEEEKEELRDIVYGTEGVVEIILDLNPFHRGTKCTRIQ